MTSPTGTPLARGFVRVTVDRRDYDRELRNLGNAPGVGDAGKKVGTELGTGIGTAMHSVVRTFAIGLTAIFATVKLGGVFAGAIQSASNLSETINKIRVVFGPASDAIL